MNIAIVDDEKMFIDDLKIHLFDALDKYGISSSSIDTFSSAEEFMRKWNRHYYSVIFLDIFMPGKTGMELAEQIRRSDNDVKLVFCTTSNEFAAESYAVKASFYMRKPYDSKSIDAMIQAVDFASIDKEQQLSFEDGYKCFVKSILYTEYNNHKVIIHLDNGDEHTLRMSQKEILSILETYSGMFQINQGNIVNFEGAERLEKENIVMQDGTSLPVSRRLRKETAEAYSAYKLEQMKMALV